MEAKNGSLAEVGNRDTKRKINRRNKEKAAEEMKLHKSLIRQLEIS